MANKLQQLKSKTKLRRIPIVDEDGTERAVAVWNPDNPRFAHWCESLMGVYAGAAKLKGLDIPDSWLTEMETATDERAAEIIDSVRKPYAEAANVIDEMEAAIDRICGEGVADALYSYCSMEEIQRLIGMIMEDHTAERKKVTGKYTA